MAARMPVQERQAKLVDAAISVMRRDGVARTTTRAIAAEADMPIGTFHYCFESKEQLFLEVMRTLTASSFETVEALLGNSIEGAELIRRAATIYWSSIEADPMGHQLTHELIHWALRQPGAEEAARAQHAQAVASFEQLFTAAARAGDFAWATPVPVLARYTLATIQGITLQWLIDRDTAGARQLVDQLCHHLLRDADL